MNTSTASYVTFLTLHLQSMAALLVLKRWTAVIIIIFCVLNPNIHIRFRSFPCIKLSIIINIYTLSWLSTLLLLPVYVGTLIIGHCVSRSWGSWCYGWTCSLQQVSFKYNNVSFYLCYVSGFCFSENIS